MRLLRYRTNGSQWTSSQAKLANPTAKPTANPIAIIGIMNPNLHGAFGSIILLASFLSQLERF